MHNGGKPEGDHLLGVQGGFLNLFAKKNLLLKDVMILRSLRHHTEEEVEGYRLHSRLTIHQVPVNALSFFFHQANSR